jgi:hypothetical protein
VANTQPIPEPLNGGLVTARDPALLEPGELVQADDAVYYPNDPAIHKVKARTKYNSAALGGAGTVKGLRYLEFDDTQSGLLLAHESNDLYLSSFADETGTFGTISSINDVGSGSTLDAVQFNNRYVALIGDTQNEVISSSGVGRKHGASAVQNLAAPTLVSGAFNPILGAGYYFFLTTEVIDDGVNPPIESTFEGTPQATTTAFTASTLSTQAVQVVQPTVVNSNATRWRIYMAGPSDNPTPIPPLALFRLVAERDIADTTAIIGNSSASGKFPTTTAVGTAGWSSPTNAFTDNNTGTRSSVNLSRQFYGTFGFAVAGTIKGIEVRVKVRVPDYSVLKNKPILIVNLTNTGGAPLIPANNSRYVRLMDIPGIIANYVGPITYGSPTDLWSRAWTSAEINAATFGASITYGIQTEGFSGANPIVDVDYLSITVYTTSGTQTQVVNLFGKPFRTVNVSVAGITTSYGADGPPPVASTGDLFEGQLVLNDISDPSLIRYSLPDNIESFPSVYFLNFESKTQDKVTCVRRLGNKLIVGLAQQMHRINYLPRETDAEFDRGRAYEAISETEGIVGTQAACLFSPDGGALLLAYVSHAGPRYTDGFQSFSLSDDLDWGATVRLPVAGTTTNYLQNCVFVNYATLQQLWLYYTPPGQTTNTKALVFHYNKAHRKGSGTYKVTGPVTVATGSATTGRIGGSELLLTGRSGGFAYVEDRGYTDAAGGTLAFAVKTREIYTAGVGRTGTVENLFIRHNQDATSTVTVTPYTRFSNAAQTTQAVKTFTTAQAGVPKLPFHHNHESIQWKLSEEAVVGTTGIRLSGLIMEVSGTGLPEPRP